MNGRFVQIPTPSGLMETFVTHPEQDGLFPPVIVYMDIWGAVSYTHLRAHET